MNIDERFEKLERDNKRLKRYVAVSISIALAALIGGTVLGVHAANGNFNIITAKNIYVKDSSGKTRVTLYGSSGIVELKDSSGKIRVKLYGNSGNLYLKDSSGKTRVMLEGRIGYLYLKDPSGKRRVALDGKYGSVKTYKSNGQVLHELGKGSGASGPHTPPVAKHNHTATTTIR